MAIPLSTLRDLFAPALYNAKSAVLRELAGPPPFAIDFQMWLDNERDLIVFAIRTPAGVKEIATVSRYDVLTGRDYFEKFAAVKQQMIERARATIGLSPRSDPGEPPPVYNRVLDALPETIDAPVAKGRVLDLGDHAS